MDRSFLFPNEVRDLRDRAVAPKGVPAAAEAVEEVVGGETRSPFAFAPEVQVAAADGDAAFAGRERAVVAGAGAAEEDVLGLSATTNFAPVISLKCAARSAAVSRSQTGAAAFSWQITYSVLPSLASSSGEANAAASAVSINSGRKIFFTAAPFAKSGLR